MTRLVSLQVGVYTASILSRFYRCLTDCLKCIAWKGRALVIGFAAGKIEKVLPPHPKLK